jgi:DNA-binding NtrC family response regulator
MKRRILLVDDELAILLTLRAILEMNGFQVETAASAKEAEHKLAHNTFEMVITDMRMETENAGYGVIRAARQQAYDPATAILTAYPSLGNDWQSKGAQSLLVKPVNTQELLRQIENLLTVHHEHKLKGQKTSGGKKLNPLPGTTERSAAAGKKAI